MSSQAPSSLIVRSQRHNLFIRILRLRLVAEFADAARESIQTDDAFVKWLGTFSILFEQQCLHFLRRGFETVEVGFLAVTQIGGKLCPVLHVFTDENYRGD